MKKWLLILFMIVPIAAFADDDEDYRSIALDAQNQAQKQMVPYKKEVHAIAAANKNRALYQHDAKEAAIKAQEILEKNIYATNQKNAIKKSAPSILIFVSFSMPLSSLEAYLRDAKKIHASVIIRGLEKNSFQVTFKRMATLIKSSNGTGIELNPLWFKRFSINQVPAVVVVPEGSVCFKQDYCSSSRDYDVIRGNITLSSALREIRNRSDLTQTITTEALEVLERGHHA